MPDASPTDNRAARIGQAASRAFAQFWYSECQKVAEQVDDPSARWDIMVRALRRIGWPES